MAKAQAEPYLSPVDVGRSLKRHPASVIRWIRNGVALSTGERLRLRAQKSPSSWLIKQSDLDAFLNAITTDRLGEVAPAVPSAQVKAMREELRATGLM